MIHVSIGTTGVLGLAHVPMASVPTTAYLMLGGRCVMNCAFCAQARESRASELALSRVVWPEFPLEEVCARLDLAAQRGDLRRCCIQVTTGRDHWRRILDAVRRIRQATSLPLNVAFLPTELQQVEALLEAGVERVGFGLDAACERVFRQVKGLHWDRMVTMVQEAARQFPGRVSVHLMAGLGETEREMVARIDWAHGLGAGVGLFAFTPVRGTALAHRSQPSLGQYRRMQAARWLIVQQGAQTSDFVFDSQGTLRGIQLCGWRHCLADGGAFRTSGCPDCNRPFYNERPGGTMYNYPHPLTPDQARHAVLEMEIEDGV